MRTRRTPIIAAVSMLALLAGCGAGTATPSPDAEPRAVAVPAAATPDGADGPADLDGFPLALGYDEENGDDHSPVRVTDRPATKAFDLCGVPAWDPRAGTTGVIGVEFRGEAEWSRGRTLVLYPSADAAVAAVAAARDAVAGCPDEPAELDYGSTHTPLDVALGDQSVAWTDTYWFTNGGEKLHDTGLTVHHLVRVGRVVLMAYEYGEGNGSEESRGQAIARATELERPVVDRMRDLGPD